LEYVIVAFPTDRIVYIDGEKNGNTNKVLRVDAGSHVFDLGPLAALLLALLLAGCVKTSEKAIEHVMVKFPDNRPLYIDGKKNGGTNEVVRVEPGTHIFDLGPAGGYQPATRRELVKDTTALAPLLLEFRRLDAR
jgi:hypothetical protein